MKVAYFLDKEANPLNILLVLEALHVSAIDDLVRLLDIAFHVSRLVNLNPELPQSCCATVSEIYFTDK